MNILLGLSDNEEETENANFNIIYHLIGCRNYLLKGIEAYIGRFWQIILHFSSRPVKQ